MSKMRMVLLLGAGFSQAAGMKSASDITEQALDLNWRSTDPSDPFYDIARPEKQSTTDKRLEEERHLLKFLDSLIKRYYRRFDLAVDSNYEDLAFVAGQIEDALRKIKKSKSPIIENPIVEFCVEEIETTLWPDNSKTDQEGSIEKLIGGLAGSARHMIYDLVWQFLLEEPTGLDNIQFIVELINDPDVSTCDVFTLNHDLVLDFLFLENRIEFIDGFGRYDENNSHDPWDPEEYDRSDLKVKLYKLHGSVNWILSSNKLYRIPASRLKTPEDFIQVRGPNGTPDNRRPQILVGKSDKELRYTEPSYLVMQYHLLQTLQKDTPIIICGYSFRDRGINAQLTRWMQSGEKSRMIVIDPNKELQVTAHGAKNTKWDESKLVIIPKYAQDVNWKEIQKHLTGR